MVSLFKCHEEIKKQQSKLQGEKNSALRSMKIINTLLENMDRLLFATLMVKPLSKCGATFPLIS